MIFVLNQIAASFAATVYLIACYLSFRQKQYYWIPLLFPLALLVGYQAHVNFLLFTGAVEVGSEDYFRIVSLIRTFNWFNLAGPAGIIFGVIVVGDRQRRETLQAISRVSRELTDSAGRVDDGG